MKLETLENRTLLSVGNSVDGIEDATKNDTQENSLEIQKSDETSADDMLKRDGELKTWNDINNVVDIILLGASASSICMAIFTTGIEARKLVQKYQNNLPSKKLEVLGIVSFASVAAFNGYWTISSLATTYSPSSDASSTTSKIAAWTSATTGFWIGWSLPLVMFYANKVVTHYRQTGDLTFLPPSQFSTTNNINIHNYQSNV